MCNPMLLVILGSETERAKRFVKNIRLNGTAFVRQLNGMNVLRTMPNLGVLKMHNANMYVHVWFHTHRTNERTKAKQTKSKIIAGELSLSQIVWVACTLKDVEKASDRKQERDNRAQHNTKSYSFSPFYFFRSISFTFHSKPMQSIDVWEEFQTEANENGATAMERKKNVYTYGKNGKRQRKKTRQRTTANKTIRTVSVHC